MARMIGKLTALKVSKTSKAGMYGDGAGLYLQVTKSGAKSWIYRFTLNGRPREMGIGPTHTIDLAEARLKAGECRKLCLDGKDPIEDRKQKRYAAALDAAKAVTFEECARAYIEAHRTGWRNAKHGYQWNATLEQFAFPIIGNLSVQNIDTGLIMKVLEQERDDHKGIRFWEAKPETANRLRGRMESILNWATVRGYRRGENPARWRGHLDHLLPRQSQVHKVEHFSALPYAEIGKFMAELDQQEGVAALALKFTILTCARTGEALNARWEELDTQQRLWIVPAARTKTAKEHRVPLSDEAMHIIKQMQSLRTSDNPFVFPGLKAGKSLSNMAMLVLLRRMNRGGLTVHGFRSTFRDWAAESTDSPREVCEMALSHAISSAVEAAYRRGDLFEKRRLLMDLWGKHCCTGSTVPGEDR